jgi:hypothetical protein
MPAKAKIQDTIPGTRNGAVPTASVEELLGKPRRTLSFQLTIEDEDGNPLTRTIIYKAISSNEYDKLLEEHPPTAKQREDSASMNIDTFAPALISAVSHEPKLTYEQAEQLYTDPSWSGGEIGTMYFNAQRVCNAGLDVPFNVRG